MPFDYGLRPHNRQRLANARAKPIEANKNQSVDGVEGLFLRSGSPQNVYLLPQHPNFRLERCPRPKQICDHPNNEPDKISHPATATPDSRSTASQIEFAIGTPKFPALATNTLQTVGNLLQETHTRVVEMSAQQVEQRVAHADGAARQRASPVEYRSCRARWSPRQLLGQSLFACRRQLDALHSKLSINLQTTLDPKAGAGALA